VKSKCKFCSYTASKPTKTFICPDCASFQPFYIELFELIEEKISSDSKSSLEIDAQKDDVFNLLSQISFIIYNDPRLNIFYNSISFLLDKAIQNKITILESEFSRNVKTIRSLTDIYNFLEDSGLLDIEFVDELKERKITLKPKFLRFT